MSLFYTLIGKYLNIDAALTFITLSLIAMDAIYKFWSYLIETRLKSKRLFYEFLSYANLCFPLLMLAFHVHSLLSPAQQSFKNFLCFLKIQCLRVSKLGRYMRFLNSYICLITYIPQTFKDRRIGKHS